MARLTFVAIAAAGALLLAACAGGSTASTGGADPRPSSVAPSGGGVGTVQDLPKDAPADGEAVAHVEEDSIDREDKRINVTLDGETTYIKNGGQVILGGGRAVELFVDPYPPSTLRAWLDVYLTQDGEPIEDASIGIEYDMLAMAHGPFSAVAENVGGGHYLFTLDYIMFGAWDQALTIRIGLDRIRFPLVLVAYP